jgi:hypothetical protein
MLEVDFWSKAAECDHAIRLVADPERRIVLESLRSLWIALCNERSRNERSRNERSRNERSLLGQTDRISPLSNIAQIHTELMAVCRSAMH